MFNPDRWEAIDSRTSSKPFHSYAFLPFSAGGRNCIGQKFALQEIMITMSMLLQKYHIKYDESKKPYYSFDVVSIPSNLHVQFIPRAL
jgi:cytochrome P450